MKAPRQRKKDRAGLNGRIINGGIITMITLAHRAQLGWTIPVTKGRRRVRPINASELCSRYSLRPAEPEAANPPATITSTNEPIPGQPLAPRKAPPIAAMTNKVTTRDLNNTENVCKFDRQPLTCALIRVPVKTLTGLSCLAKFDKILNLQRAELYGLG